MADTIEQMLQGQIDILKERVRQLEEILVPSGLTLPVEWRLTASEARVFAHLTTRDECSKDSIMRALYLGRIDEEPEIKIVDVFVCKLRKKLRPFDVEIRTIWGQGYSLENRAAYVPEKVQ